MIRKVYKKRWPEHLKAESVEEFLARGGKINDCTPLKQVVSDEQIKEFYTTPEWKELRKETYAKLTHFCPVCGSEEKLVVDHIKPVRFFWEERLNPDNLQILCDDCNLEKASNTQWTLKNHIKNKEYLSDWRQSKTNYIQQKKKEELFPQSWIDLFEKK
jgi:5-methylcytosine-specific restriction endonuclease McrA